MKTLIIAKLKAVGNLIQVVLKIVTPFAEAFLLITALVYAIQGNKLQALYNIALVIFSVLIDIRIRLQKNAEVDLRIGSDLTATIIAGFLKSNPEYKLMKREGDEPQTELVKEDEAGA